MEVTTKIKRTIEIERIIINLSFTEAMALKDILYTVDIFSGNLYYKLRDIEKENT